MKDFFKKAWGAVTAYPSSLEDYVGVGRWLVYKKLLALLAAAAVLAAALLAWRLFSPEKPFALPTFYYWEDSLKVFSGEAVLLDEKDRVVYRGQIAGGLWEGHGTRFDPMSQRIVYEGEYAGNAYNGQGRLYRDGKLWYEGGFLNGQYSGSGTLYQGDAVLYKGQFVEGSYSGRGVLYEAGGVLYEGGFWDGLYDGEGALCREDGSPVYVGGFAKGRYHGYGILSAPDGASVYEGDFKNGLYDGQGCLYSADGVRLAFEGEFVRGAPARKGGIHNARGQLLYQGNIRGGQADYIGLLGLTAAELQKQVRETPVVYCGDGWAGFLYPELGFAVLARYDYRAPGAFAEEAPEAGGGEPLPALSGELVFDTLLAEGARLYGELPTAGTAEVYKAELTGFEAFLCSRLAEVTAPASGDGPQPEVTRRGDRLYEVKGLPESVDYGETGAFQDGVSYFYRKAEAEKGGTPKVILCERIAFGG